jgi:hypothetical protein
VWRYGPDSFVSGQGLVVGLCEPLTSVGSGEFLDKLSDYQLLKTDCAPWG